MQSTMVCARCNKVTDATGTCPKCKTRLATLASQQRRGWVAFAAGAFLVLFMVGIWIWVDRLFAANGIVSGDAGAAAFLGRLNIAFALIALSGVLGAGNGWWMAHSGLRNYPLLFGLVIVFVAGMLTAWLALNAYHPS